MFSPSKISHICLVLLSILTTGWSYTQEIILYDNLDLTGTSYVMREHVPDTSFVGVVRSFCTRGFWSAHTEANYEGLTINYHGQDGELYCINNTGGDYKSFRFGGASDTNVEAISVYPGPAYMGDEMLVEGSSMGNISGLSVLYSGGSTWTLYEGPSFNGKYCCVSTSDYYMELGVDGEFNVHSALGMEQIGSVVKGCAAHLLEGQTGRSNGVCYEEEASQL